ncbi:MAG TPA: hypothetical protein VMR25_12815 [Planctomycetaceae bacterium]|jgi:hypothetical protein|nr:hypothetical protein [Planctomycetaceae bacterium]
MTKLQQPEDETTARLRKLGRACLDRWEGQASKPGYLLDWAAQLKAAISAGELRVLYQSYARRARNPNLPKWQRLENRKRASALKRILPRVIQ